MSKIKAKLEDSLSSTDLNKSSYWQHHSKDLNQYSFKTFKLLKKNFFRSILHNFFSKLVYGKEIFKTDEFKEYKKQFDRMDRIIDNDTMRHVFTLNLLKKYINPKKICVIGDGRACFFLGALNIFKNSQIIHVNLNEMLLNDYTIISDLKVLDDEKIQLINNENETFGKEKKLILVPASLKKVLLNQNIDLFVNIASMEEMTSIEINKYFEIIKNNNSLFYCCNREYKRLYDGEEAIFSRYPWGEGNKLFFENCKWHQKFYIFKFPFIIKYNGTHKHCLIDYSGSFDKKKIIPGSDVEIEK
tara:strand:- start:11 stop:913 length:903 start_codon:yes stop_codon:yes gene_type:complete